MPVKKISSDQVGIGMYVTNLDRPWIETPFLFQGFEVSTHEEIEELSRCSQYVYVLEPDEEINIKQLSTIDSAGLAPNTNILHKKNYANTVNADDEIKKVRKSHETVTHLLSEVESVIRKEGSIPLKAFEEPIENMVDSVTHNPDAYLWLTRLKKFDSFLYKDSMTSAVLGTAMGRRLGLAEESLQKLATGCLLMDVGKMSLPVELLHKAGRLDQAEWEMMKRHVQLGLQLLESSQGCNQEVFDIVRTHHERIDGCGYPAGLQNNHIPLFGQIAGIVDQYVSVTSPRPYANTISPSQAEHMLFKQRGRIFDEMLVEYFIQTISTYPTGSLVELSTGEVAVVKQQNSRLHLKPDVILLLNPEKIAYGNYPVVSMDNYRKDNNPVSIMRTLADGEYGVRIENLSI